MGTALLHWVLGTQGEDGQVLQWQQQFGEGQVQLLGKDLAHLVALVLQAGMGGIKTEISTKGIGGKSTCVTSNTSCVSITLGIVQKP